VSEYRNKLCYGQKINIFAKSLLTVKVISLHEVIFHNLELANRRQVIETS
jgi:hypothetical protein